MPFILRYPAMTKPGSVNADMILNVDFAPLFLDLAQANIPPEMQGHSLLPLLRGETPPDWRQSMYYRYWMHRDSSHNVYAHYGIRTHHHKLIHYYGDGLGLPGTANEPTTPEWELFDLEQDPCELENRYHDPAYAAVVQELKTELARLQAEVDDVPYPPPSNNHG